MKIKLKQLLDVTLMTAYGYAGDAALSLSDTDDTSRNSTLMTRQDVCGSFQAFRVDLHLKVKVHIHWYLHI
ncbi:MAG: hypothetical protein ACLR10_04365 [Oscillospiraceae bacterium]